MPESLESQNTEFKESWQDEYLKWICGFANAQGGKLLIGVNDRGEVVGVPNIKKLMEDIPNKVRDILGIMLDVNLHEAAGKHFIEMNIEPYPYPVSYKGQYHYRSGSTKQELKGAALDQFLLKKQGKTWDGVPVPRVSADDLIGLKKFRVLALNSDRIEKNFLDEKDSHLLEKLRLFETGYLKRAAVLLFYPDPEKYVTGAFIKIGFFENDGELLYQDEVHGILFEQVDKTIELLTTKYLKAEISYQGIYRKEKFPVPKEALREAILNAVTHKDYASNVPIQISVYADKLMIWNNGQLHAGWTVDSLFKKHASQPFNPDIANTFFRAGLIEAWGRGIEKMLSACKEHSAPLPEIQYEKGGLWVVFKFPAEKTSEKMSEKTSEKIVALIKNNSTITIEQLSENTGVTSRSIERNLKKLQEQKKIRRVGAAKGGHWEIIND